MSNLRFSIFANNTDVRRNIISRKLDNLTDQIRQLNYTTDNLCGSEFAQNTVGLYTTILSFFFGTVFALSFTWISGSILRMVSYVVLFAIMIAVMTLWRWNRRLISTMKDWRETSKQLNDLTSDLSDKHNALAFEYQKKSDIHEQLNQHYNILVAVLRFTGLDMKLGITKLCSEEEVNNEREDS